MNFVSYAFLALLATVLLVRFNFGRRKTEPTYVVVLIVSSLLFYAWHVPVYLPILLTSTIIDYLAGLYLGQTTPQPPSPKARKGVLLISLATNLGMLGFFKYADFGLASLQDVLSALGVQAHMPTLGWILPIGISFYTFQSMSYTIDVYRSKLTPLRSFWKFLLYVSFFPQLVAGPIVRASEFLPQLERVRRPNLPVLTEGVYWLIQGFFLKMVCADNLAPYVDEYWQDGYVRGADSGVLIWLTLMFSCQIFCDFAGYSNIARGLAYMLGYRLPINFNFPYIAGSFRNFWERWHISLSSWLRDYLYVSLGGNRISKVRTYVNLLLVMVLGGLWHGAAYTFVAWGTLHGSALAVERALDLQSRKGWRGRAAVRATWFVVVQIVVLITWVFFRSDGLSPTLQFLGNIAAFKFSAPNATMWVGSVFMVPVVVMHLWKFLEEQRVLKPMSGSLRAVLAGAMLYGVLTCYGATNAFVYFQF